MSAELRDIYGNPIERPSLRDDVLPLDVITPLESDKYLHDPVGWAERFIDFRGSELGPYQTRIMGKLMEKHRVAARSPHGAGKSTTAAITVIWFAYTRDQAGIDWKVITTATAWRHLTIYLWPEIHKWIRRVKWDELGMRPPDPRKELLDLRLKLKHGAASAVASDEAVNIEGAHADSILYLFDESKAIPNATWDAAEGALSGGNDDGSLPEAFVLAISTPGPPSGRFYDIHQRKPGTRDWHPMHIRVQEAIRAGRINESWVEQRKLQWGEESALYKNRVLGEFHAQDEDSVIPLSWIEVAVERWHEWDEDGRKPIHGAHVVSVDVARGGQDKTAISIRSGHCVEKITQHNFADTMKTTALAASKIQHGQTAIVDSMGVGAGVIDRLRELKLRAVPYTGSAKTNAMDASREFGFTNTRSAAYWNMRELLDPSRESQIMLPDNDQLLADLTAPRWDITSGAPPRIKVEPKEEVGKRLGHSPDTADSVVMSFWADKAKGEFHILIPSERQAEERKKEEPRKRGVAPKIVKKALKRRQLSPLS